MATLSVCLLAFSVGIFIFSVVVAVSFLVKGKREEDARQFQREIANHRMFAMIHTLEKAGRLREVGGNRSLEEVYLDFLREQAPEFDTSRIVAGSRAGTLYIPTKKARR